LGWGVSRRRRRCLRALSAFGAAKLHAAAAIRLAVVTGPKPAVLGRGVSRRRCAV
jgi:hypothetical protein